MGKNSKVSTLKFYPNEAPQIDHISNDSFFGECCLQMGLFLISFLLIGPILTVVFIIWLFSTGVRFVCKLTKDICQKESFSGRNETVTFEEAKWLDDLNTSAVSVLVLEKALTVSDLEKVLKEKIDFEKKNRLFFKPIRQSFQWIWVEDDEFELTNHITDIEIGSSNLSVVIQTISQLPFANGKPLWRIFLIKTTVSVRYSEETTEDVDPYCTVVLKIHPSISDGVSLLKFLSEVVSDSPTPYVSRDKPNSNYWILKMSKCIFYGMEIFFKKWLLLTSFDINGKRRSLYEKSDSDNKEVSPEKIIVEDCEDVHEESNGKDLRFAYNCFPLDNLMRLKLITRSTMTEIILALVASSVKHHNIILSQSYSSMDIPSVIPVDVSTVHKKEFHDFTNFNTFSDFVLPLNTEGMLPMIWEIKQRLKQLKRDYHYVFLNVFPRLLSKLFSQNIAQRTMRFYHKKSPIYISSMKGPNDALSIKGKMIKNIFFCFPIFGILSLSVSCLSYNDQMIFCFNGKQSSALDITLLSNVLTLQIKALSKLLEYRKVPKSKNDVTPENNDAALVNSNISLQTMSHEEILDRLNEVQIKLQNESSLNTDQISNLRGLYSILFAALKAERRKASLSSDELDENVESQPVAASRRKSLPVLFVRKNSEKLTLPKEQRSQF